MIQDTPMKSRPAGKFIRPYLDGVVYEELRKKAKKMPGQHKRRQFLLLRRH